MISQTTHAAGESLLYQGRWDPDHDDFPGNSKRECRCKHSYTRGYGYLYRDECGLCLGRGIEPPLIHAVALGARSEESLVELELRLISAGIPHRAIREPDAPYAGALMAIGIEPRRDRSALKPILKGYKLIGGNRGR